MTNHPPETVLRHEALALRDFAELFNADEATVTINGVTVTYSPDDGFHLVPVEGDPVDITDWVDQVWLVPA